MTEDYTGYRDFIDALIQAGLTWEEAVEGWEAFLDTQSVSRPRTAPLVESEQGNNPSLIELIMPLPRNLDAIDLDILSAIAAQPGIRTRTIQGAILLSRVQSLRRLQRLTNLGLITRSDGERGKAYYYTVTPNVKLEDIKQYSISESESLFVDPVAREALRVLTEGLAEILSRLEGILK